MAVLKITVLGCTLLIFMYFRTFDYVLLSKGRPGVVDRTLLLIKKIGFTLYPAHSRVGRENLVLRQSVPHSLTFRWVLEALRVEWRISTPLFASTPEWRNENINVNKYFISTSGYRFHNQSILLSHFVNLRRDWHHFLTNF